MFNRLSDQIEQLDRHALVGMGDCGEHFWELDELNRDFRVREAVLKAILQKDSPPSGFPIEWTIQLSRKPRSGVSRLHVHDDEIAFRQGEVVMPWEPIIGFTPMTTEEAINLHFYERDQGVSEGDVNLPIVFARELNKLIAEVKAQINSIQMQQNGEESLLLRMSKEERVLRMEELRGQIDMRIIKGDLVDSPSPEFLALLMEYDELVGIGAHNSEGMRKAVARIRTRFNPIEGFRWAKLRSSELLKSRYQMANTFGVEHFNMLRGGQQSVQNLRAHGWVVS